MLQSLHLDGGDYRGPAWARGDMVMGRLLKAFLALPQVRDLAWSWEEEAWGGSIKLPHRPNKGKSPTKPESESP